MEKSHLRAQKKGEMTSTLRHVNGVWYSPGVISLRSGQIAALTVMQSKNMLAEAKTKKSPSQNKSLLIKI